MDGARRTLAGRYELAEVIGRGGMGTVYRARDLVLERTVAVKVLPGAVAEQDPTHVARFEREARAAAALAHPGVVAVYDAGADEATRFIVMECVAGRSLDAIVRDEAPLEPDRAVKIAERVADALAAAHVAGIVHRDVKPGNVMVAEDGSVKVLDFGIARLLDGTALTHSASVVGTAAYMAPEQALGERADERCDIYAMGCVLYAMLAGRPPFVGEAVSAVLNQHVNVDPRPLREVHRRVSPALDALVRQMLAKSPDARPHSAAEVRDRLANVAARPPAAPAPAQPEAPAPAPTAPTAPIRRTATAAMPPRKTLAEHRRMAAAAALAGVVLVIAVIALALSDGSRPSTRAARRSSTSSSASRTSTRQLSTAARSSGTTSSASTVASSTPAPSPTVAGAAGTLTALLTQDVASGKIDPQAAQEITKTLSDTLSSYELGHIIDARRKLADLSQNIAMLGGQGPISSAAAATLTAALSNMSSALAKSAPPPALGGQPAGQPDQPQGHGGQPPGQEKKHGD